MREQPPIILRGTWHTNFGELALDTYEKNAVIGRYQSGSIQGGVEGTVEGTVLVGRWWQDRMPDRKGYFKLLFTPDVARFNGLWSFGDQALQYPWDGTKI